MHEQTNVNLEMKSFIFPMQYAMQIVLFKDENAMQLLPFKWKAQNNYLLFQMKLNKWCREEA